MPMEQNFPLYETAPKRVAVRPSQDRSWCHLADVSAKISLYDAENATGYQKNHLLCKLNNVPMHKNGTLAH